VVRGGLGLGQCGLRGGSVMGMSVLIQLRGGRGEDGGVLLMLQWGCYLLFLIFDLFLIF